MLRHLKDYDKFLEITGYKPIKFATEECFLKAIRRENRKKIELQFFDADLIATDRHLYFATLNGLQAFKNKVNISKSLSMETMLYASAQRQIHKAIQRCGIKQETTRMAALVAGDDPTQVKNVLQSINDSVGVEPDDGVLAMTKAKERRICEVFEISKNEVEAVMKNNDHGEAVVSLVIERIALLATQL